VRAPIPTSMPAAATDLEEEDTVKSRGRVRDGTVLLCFFRTRDER
jgi:hypothetical protein